MLMLKKARRLLAKLTKRSSSKARSSMNTKEEATAWKQASPSSVPAPLEVKSGNEPRNAVPSKSKKNGECDVDLLPPLSEETPFPLEALGERGKTAVEAAMQITQAPPALCGQSALAVMSMAASPHVDVVAPHGQTRPTACFFLTIAKSGERKSAVDDKLLGGINRLQEHLMYDYQAELRAIKAKKDGDDTQEGRGEELPPPLSPMLLVQDATYEGVLRTLSGGRGFAGMFNADAGDLICGIGMAPENKVKMAAGTSRFWDGSTVLRSRKGDGDSMIAHKRLALHLQFQPVVAAGFIDDPTLDGQGFFARCLISWPTSTIGSRLFREAPTAASKTVEDFQNWTYEALKELPTYRGRSLNDLAPRSLLLTPAAKNSWIGFYNDVERSLTDELQTIQPFGAKAAEHALRLAGILTWADDEDATKIDADNMDRGIVLARYYIDEMLRLRKAKTANPDAQAMTKLLAWIQKRQAKTVSSQDLNKNGPDPFRNDWKRARKALDDLASRGHLTAISVQKTRFAEHVTYEVRVSKAA